LLAQIVVFMRGVHTELALHKSYAATWGIELDPAAGAAGVRPSPATLAYTDFLMQVAGDPRTVRVFLG
jgi:thiaminase (transcriptional activator TenA)